jgi:hypothetical protein
LCVCVLWKLCFQSEECVLCCVVLCCVMLCSNYLTHGQYFNNHNTVDSIVNVWYYLSLSFQQINQRRELSFPIKLELWLLSLSLRLNKFDPFWWKLKSKLWKWSLEIERVSMISIVEWDFTSLNTWNVKCSLSEWMDLFSSHTIWNIWIVYNSVINNSCCLKLRLNSFWINELMWIMKQHTHYWLRV